MKKQFAVLFIALVVVIFFWKFFINGLLPIPADTIVGLYHPFRDFYAKEYPNGIPFKNFLITDPVRQEYPWRELAMSIAKKFELPLWNPYNFSGTPLLANFQSAIFYPFNLLFFLLPFHLGWSVLIMLQPLLAGIFLYWYLRSLSIHPLASFLGSFVFAFCGFSVAWMEWGTILHATLWLPLILLSTEKIFFNSMSANSKFKSQSSKLSFDPELKTEGQLKNKKLLTWGLVFVFSLVSSFFAGHLQVFFYVLLFTSLYILARWIQYKKIFNVLFVFLIFIILFLILSSVQWIPTLQLILHSARDIDQADWTKEGWFIPWQHLIQFVAPDFFGNPATLNYWGVWNYGELVGYVGILPLIMAIFALFFRHDKKTFFFGTIFFIALVFSLPTFFAKLPYILNIPFLSTTQPTRVLLIADFSLAILASFGFDYFTRSKKREIVYPLIFIFFMLLGIWSFVIFGNEIAKIVTAEDMLVAKRNLVFPTLIFIVSAFLLLALIGFSKFHKSFTIMIYIIIVAVTVFDLLRFGLKFTPFTNKNYLFPETKTISFLQKNLGNHRVMITDSRILPPNFSAIYRLQSVDGYDPLYLRRYGELIAASERGEPNISPPFGFNRIITPHNYDSKIIDLLGVRYILSLSDLHSPKLKKVFQEGQTRVYENMDVSPRVFFVKNVKYAKNKEEAVQIMFDKDFDPRFSAVIEYPPFAAFARDLSVGKADIVHYSENEIIVETDISEEGFLVLTDSFYPIWKTRIYEHSENIPDDSPLSKSMRKNGSAIFRTDYNFRGILVPGGKNRVEFYNSLL